MKTTGFTNTLAAIVLAVGSGTALAAPPTGSNEMSVAGTYADVEDTNLTALQLTYGYYIDPMHEVGVGGSFVKFEVEDEFDLDGSWLSAFYNLNFPTSGVMQPYLGVNVATIGGDLGDAYDFAYGASAGIKFYPFENAGILVSFNYQKFQAADDFFDDSDATSLNVGLLIRF